MELADKKTVLPLGEKTAAGRGGPRQGCRPPSSGSGRPNPGGDLRVRGTELPPGSGHRGGRESGQRLPGVCPQGVSSVTHQVGHRLMMETGAQLRSGGNRASAGDPAAGP